MAVRYFIALLRPIGLLLIGTLPLTGRAQSCQGVLGEAIVSQSFGVRGAGPLPAGQTTFQYVPKPCLGDGEYNLADTVAGGCHGNAWHTVRDDHTPGDQYGNMLIVNASFQPSEFFNQSVRGLCAGTTYEFSFWVLNIHRIQPPGSCGLDEPRDPIIAMRIETPAGTRIGEVSTGVVPRTPGPVWKRYAMLFTMPPDADVLVLKLINEGLGGCGNDLALDDIQFRPCLPRLSATFDGSTDTTRTGCQFSTVTLTSTLGDGYTDPVYRWQESLDGTTWRDLPNATTPRYVLTAPVAGTRWYRLRAAQRSGATAPAPVACGALSNRLTLTIEPAAPFSLGDDRTVCPPGQVVIRGPTDGPPGTRYRWSDGSTGPTLLVSEAGTYWLESVRNDCSFRDSVRVTEGGCRFPAVYVPTAFTPNGDGVNDQFRVVGGPFSTFVFRVYDRWGNVLFMSHRPEEGWDGTYRGQRCGAGTYAWTLEGQLTDDNQSLFSVTKRGSVLLID